MISIIGFDNNIDCITENRYHNWKLEIVNWKLKFINTFKISLLTFNI